MRYLWSILAQKQHLNSNQVSTSNFWIYRRCQGKKNSCTTREKSSEQAQNAGPDSRWSYLNKSSMEGRKADGETTPDENTEQQMQERTPHCPWGTCRNLDRGWLAEAILGWLFQLRGCQCRKMALFFRKLFQSEMICWPRFSLNSYSTRNKNQRRDSWSKGAKSCWTWGHRHSSYHPHYFCVGLKLS